MFVTNEDYIVISQDALRTFEQSSESNRETAIAMAIEEASGYLRSRYDTELAFAQEGTDRNPMLKLCIVDISLYHMVSWLPQKMGYEIRLERYEKAIEYLSAVQTGKIVPNLPSPQGTGNTGDTEASTNSLRVGSMQKNQYDY